MKATQRAKSRLPAPTIKVEDVKRQVIEDIDKQNKYAIAATTNKKFSLITATLAKNAARVKKIEETVYTKDNKPTAERQNNTLASLASSMSVIASSLNRINVLLAKTLGTQAPAAATPDTPEAGPGAERVATPEPSGGLFSMLKSLFLNPAVVAAIAGIVYTVLPQEMQQKIKDLLSGFGIGLEEAMGKNEEEGLGGFNTALKAAGIALTTYFGAKMIASIADAITLTLKIIKVFGGGKLGKGALVLGGAAVAGAVGTAVYSKMKDDEEPEGAPAPAGTTPSSKPQQAEQKPYTGSGLKPSQGGGYGMKVPAPPDDVKGAISQAAKRVGVDESIMLAMAKQESGFNPSAKAGTSSAKGLYQFIDSTWASMSAKYGSQYPELAKGPMDPLASAIAGALYIKENADILKKNGLPVNGTNLYAMHFLGPGGGPKLLKAPADTIAADLFPGPAASNKNIFYDSNGRPRTVAEVEQLLYGKVGKNAEAYASMLGQAPTMAAAPAAEPVTTASNKGEQVKSLSQDIKVAVTTPKVETTVNSIDGSRTEAINQASIDPDSIPSPIAQRGSLSAFTKHATAGIPMAT
jgi:hypothetical protein